MSLAWVEIFVVGLLIASQRDRLSGLKTLFADQQVAGTETQIRMAEDAHFWADADLNGVRRRMLIDSGATTAALSTATAKAAGLDSDESPLPVIRVTANGDVSVRTLMVRRVRIGTIATPIWES